jgi:hypothetical protein
LVSTPRLFWPRAVGVVAAVALLDQPRLPFWLTRKRTNRSRRIYACFYPPDRAVLPAGGFYAEYSS